MQCIMLPGRMGGPQSNSQEMAAMKLRTKRLSQLPSCVNLVETWQRYLKSKGVYSGSPNGSFDAATDAATEKYRQKTYLRGDDVFVLSFDQPDRDYFRPDSGVDLTSSIKGILSKIAYGYYILTGRELEVTSGKRPPEKQAALMRERARYGKSALVGLYRSTKLVDAIWEAYDKAHKAGAGENGEVEAMTAVIRDQMSNSEYISKHLTGYAFDVKNQTMNNCEKEAFKAAVQEVLGSLHGYLLEDEHSGPQHFHVQFDR